MDDFRMDAKAYDALKDRIGLFAMSLVGTERGESAWRLDQAGPPQRFLGLNVLQVVVSFRRWTEVCNRP